MTTPTTVRHATHPSAVPGMTTADLRGRFLVEDLLVPGDARAAYLHEDRILALGVVPLHGPLTLPDVAETRSEHLLQRREAGVINVGGPGVVTVDGTSHPLPHTGVLYVGRGAEDVTFASTDPAEPAAFYVFTALAHTTHPTTPVPPEAMTVVELGSTQEGNRRTLYQCIVDGGVASAQIAFGFTTVHPGSSWNTMPAHTHDRRTECYLYFDLAEQDRVVHVMGEPQETRHLLVADRELVVSPSWSVHFGAGTGSYSFVWATAGENAAWGDMDHVASSDLR